MSKFSGLICKNHFFADFSSAASACQQLVLFYSLSRVFFPDKVHGDETDKTHRATKVVSDSPGLVDFAIGLVNSVFNLPNGQVVFFEEFE